MYTEKGTENGSQNLACVCAFSVEVKCLKSCKMGYWVCIDGNYHKGWHT